MSEQNNNGGSNGETNGVDGGKKAPYGQYQLDIYTQALVTGKKPIITTDPNKLEEAAKKVMTPEAFGYVAGGAGEGSTMQSNRLSFRQWKLVPRMLKPTVPRDLSVTLFGKKYGETAVASACASLSVPFIYSTASATPLEDVAAAADAVFSSHSPPPHAPRWFQLYWPLTPALTQSLLSRAGAAHCSVLVVTLDTFNLAWRPLDLDHGYLPFMQGQGCALGFSDPVFRKRFAEQNGGKTPEEDVAGASKMWTGEVFSGWAHRWEDLQELRKMWQGEIVLKGVLSVEDARMAVRCGVDGIVVSNHGGRQLDGAVGSLEVLPEIVDAVGGETMVLFDSGVRTGVDVLKALALGAKAVLVGRPVIYGLGAAGEEGARHVLAGLLADVDQSMGLAGVKRVGS